MTIGEKIYKLRQQKGVSQETMALDLNVSRQAISKWETDQSIPDLDKIKILSEYFNVSIDDLVNGKNLDINKDSKTDQTIDEKIDDNQYESSINSSKRLAKLLIKTSIALSIYNYILACLLIIFQKDIILFRYAKVYDGFIFPYVFVIFTSITTLFIVLSGISILKKMKSSEKSIVREIVFIIILTVGFILWKELYALFTSYYINSLHITITIAATYLEQILNSLGSFDILLLIGIIIEAITRLIDSNPSSFYPKKEYKPRDSVLSFLVGLFLGIPGLIFQIIWLKDAKTDNVQRFKQMRMWYIIGFVITFILSLIIVIFELYTFIRSISMPLIYIN